MHFTQDYQAVARRVQPSTPIVAFSSYALSITGDSSVCSKTEFGGCSCGPSELKPYSSLLKGPMYCLLRVPLTQKCTKLTVVLLVLALLLPAL